MSRQPSVEAKRALDEAHAALAAQPPQRDAARRALGRALTAGAADDDRSAVSEAYFRLGGLDEQDEAFARAAFDYRESLRASPVSAGAPWSSDASARMLWLNLRSEGDYAPLVRLSRMKRDPALSSDPAAMEAFARDVEAMPPGIVRGESRVFLGAAWLGPLHRPKDAIDQLRKVMTDPTTDPVTQLSARRGLVDALIADGQIAEAASEIDEHAPQLDAGVVTRVTRLAHRKRITRGAWVVLALSAGLVVAALVRARRSGGLGALWAQMRVMGVILCAVSAVAAALLVIAAVSPAYLERIGI